MKFLRFFGILAFCCFLSTLSAAQIPVIFTVIKSSGTVLSDLTKKQIRPGDQVKSTDKLVFGSPTSYLHVVSPEGRKTIRRVPDNSPRELQQLMQNFLGQDRKSRSSRGFNEGMERLLNEMAYDTLLILGAGRFDIDTTANSLKRPSGIMVSYAGKSGKTEKQISDKTGFNLGREYLFGTKETPPFPRVTVKHMENTADPVFASSLLMGSFVPLYIDEASLSKELKPIIDYFQAAGKSSKDVQKEVLSYLSAEYAQPLSDNVRDWLVAAKLVK